MQKSTSVAVPVAVSCVVALLVLLYVIVLPVFAQETTQEASSTSDNATASIAAAMQVNRYPVSAITIPQGKLLGQEGDGEDNGSPLAASRNWVTGQPASDPAAFPAYAGEGVGFLANGEYQDFVSTFTINNGGVFTQANTNFKVNFNFPELLAIGDNNQREPVFVKVETCTADCAIYTQLEADAVTLTIGEDVAATDALMLPLALSFTKPLDQEMYSKVRVTVRGLTPRTTDQRRLDRQPYPGRLMAATARMSVEGQAKTNATTKISYVPSEGNICRGRLTTTVSVANGKARLEQMAFGDANQGNNQGTVVFRSFKDSKKGTWVKNTNLAPLLVDSPDQTRWVDFLQWDTESRKGPIFSHNNPLVIEREVAFTNCINGVTTTVADRNIKVHVVVSNPDADILKGVTSPIASGSAMLVNSFRLPTAPAAVGRMFLNTTGDDQVSSLSLPISSIGNVDPDKWFEQYKSLDVTVSSTDKEGSFSSNRPAEFAIPPGPLTQFYRAMTNLDLDLDLDQSTLQVDLDVYNGASWAQRTFRPFRTIHASNTISLPEKIKSVFRTVIRIDELGVMWLAVIGSESDPPAEGAKDSNSYNQVAIYQFKPEEEGYNFLIDGARISTGEWQYTGSFSVKPRDGQVNTIRDFQVMLSGNTGLGGFNYKGTILSLDPPAGNNEFVFLEYPSNPVGLAASPYQREPLPVDVKVFSPQAVDTMKVMMVKTSSFTVEDPSEISLEAKVDGSNNTYYQYSGPPERDAHPSMTLRTMVTDAAATQGMLSQYPYFPIGIAWRASYAWRQSPSDPLKTSDVPVFIAWTKDQIKSDAVEQINACTYGKSNCVDLFLGRSRDNRGREPFFGWDSTDNTTDKWTMTPWRLSLKTFDNGVVAGKDLVRDRQDWVTTGSNNAFYPTTSNPVVEYTNTIVDPITGLPAQYGTAATGKLGWTRTANNEYQVQPEIVVNLSGQAPRKATYPSQLKVTVNLDAPAGFTLKSVTVLRQDGTQVPQQDHPNSNFSFNVDSAGTIGVENNAIDGCADSTICEQSSSNTSFIVRPVYTATATQASTCQEDGSGGIQVTTTVGAVGETTNTVFRPGVFLTSVEDGESGDTVEEKAVADKSCIGTEASEFAQLTKDVPSNWSALAVSKTALAGMTASTRDAAEEAASELETVDGVALSPLEGVVGSEYILYGYPTTVTDGSFINKASLSWTCDDDGSQAPGNEGGFTLQTANSCTLSAQQPEQAKVVVTKKPDDTQGDNIFDSPSNTQIGKIRATRKDVNTLNTLSYVIEVSNKGNTDTVSGPIYDLINRQAGLTLASIRLEEDTALALGAALISAPKNYNSQASGPVEILSGYGFSLPANSSRKIYLQYTWDSLHATAAQKTAMASCSTLSESDQWLDGSKGLVNQAYGTAEYATQNDPLATTACLPVQDNLDAIITGLHAQDNSWRNNDTIPNKFAIVEPQLTSENLNGNSVTTTADPIIAVQVFTHADSTNGSNSNTVVNLKGQLPDCVQLMEWYISDRKPTASATAGPVSSVDWGEAQPISADALTSTQCGSTGSTDATSNFTLPVEVPIRSIQSYSTTTVYVRLHLKYLVPTLTNGECSEENSTSGLRLSTGTLTDELVTSNNNACVTLLNNPPTIPFQIRTIDHDGNWLRGATYHLDVQTATLNAGSNSLVDLGQVNPISNPWAWGCNKENGAADITCVEATNNVLPAGTYGSYRTKTRDEGIDSQRLYYIRQETAPPGTVLLPQAIPIWVGDNGIQFLTSDYELVAVENSRSTSPDRAATLSLNEDGSMWVINIMNPREIALPATGASGPAPYIVGGLCVMLLGLWLGRRKELYR